MKESQPCPEAPGPRTGPPLSRRKRLLFILASVFLGTVAGFSILEVILRLMSWDLKGVHHIGALHRYHPIFGREQVPNREVLIASGHAPIMYRINEFGFRDSDPVERERTPGVPRLVFLGDSLTWGWGVREEEAVSEQLEELTGVEALNMAVNATGTGQAWQMLSERAVGFDPDVVVLGFFVGNDYRNNISRSDKRPQFRLSDTGDILIENVPVPYSVSQRVSDFIKEHTLSYFYIQYQLKQVKKRYFKTPRTEPKRLLDDEPDPDEPDITQLSKYRKEPEASIQRSFAVTKALLAEVRDTCDQHGIKLLVAVIPDNFQVEDDMWEQLIEESGNAPSLYDRSIPTQVCLDLCDELGIDSVDLYPDLRAAYETGEMVYLPRNIHWTARGHEVAAGSIRRKLDDLSWVPLQPPRPQRGQSSDG